ncbi:MAG: CoA pyrophosphatase [Saprospiraceae bacterium]|nr:CoA pyrophosphatase [Saprospiraceae bacterium]
MTDTFIERLIERHAQGLPGRPFQLKKAVLARYKTMDAPPTARQSAVLILLFRKTNEWHVVLTERVGNPNDPHSNQISFPGGSLEAADASLEACALRETHEEVGISPEKVKIIGKMTDLYIPVSNFFVQPYLGWTSEPPQYQRQPTEVKNILEVPLSILANIDNHKFADIQVRGMTLPNVPYFDVNGKIVWGATAMMLSELLEILPL